jgi:hypothetical protein
VFGDRISVFSCDAELLYSCDCRTWPNYKQPKTGKLYAEAYGAVSACRTTWEYRDEKSDKKNGPCLLLNFGDKLPCEWPNVNHAGSPIITGVKIHCAYSDKLPGSAGCITIRPDLYQVFINQFKQGDTGEFLLMIKPCEP